MATLIKDASTINEINDVLKLRYSVLKETGSSLNGLFNSTGKVSDFFDVYPNTYNVIAYRAGEAIATLRAVPYCPPKKLGGTVNSKDPSEHDVLDEVFDYTEADAQLKGEGYFIDIVLIRKKYAKNGKKRYFDLFNSTTISDYIISKSFDLDIKKPLKWMK